MATLPSYPGLVIESEERVWKGRFPVDLIRFRHQRFDGQRSGPRKWELFRRGQAAALLPYDPVTDEVVLMSSSACRPWRRGWIR
jgi:ADP-ribose pyrophosphatase